LHRIRCDQEPIMFHVCLLPGLDRITRNGPSKGTNKANNPHSRKEAKGSRRVRKNKAANIAIPKRQNTSKARIKSGEVSIGLTAPEIR
jgi:hypothetical protein